MIITLNKLKIYEKYSGNIESWDRFGKNKDKTVLSYEEWELIDDLLQKLEWESKGIASGQVRTSTLNLLNQYCDTEMTQNKLRSFVGKYN